MKIVDLTEVMDKAWPQIVDKGVRVPLEFEDKPHRKVVVEVNTSEPTQFYLELEEGPRRFIANVDGRGRLKFAVQGPAALWADTDGEVWWWTPELENVSVVIETPEIFTKVLERASRNPQLEAVIAKQQLNQQRRDAKQAAERAELRAMIATQAEALEALKPKDKKADEKKPDEKKPDEEKKAE